MKKLDQSSYQEMQTWMHRNARPLEMAVWNYLYEDGKREAALQELAYYQNEDGGFGNGVEPDCWTRESSPYATLAAIGILRQLDLVNAAGAENSVVQGILKYLNSGEYSDDHGWFFSIPANDQYPRAPWWTFSEETNRVQNMGVTAGICAFILRCADKSTSVYEKALGYTRQILQDVMEIEDFGEMGAENLDMLLTSMDELGLQGLYLQTGIREKLHQVINSTIERNPEQWAQYTPRPSAFIHSPKSPYYQENEDIVEAQLTYMIDHRNAGGVWNITWMWYGMEDKYAKEFAISENWWMGIQAINILQFLKNFGRM